MDPTGPSTEDDYFDRFCRLIATHAHAGQVDKAGKAYIHHPAAVAAMFTDPFDRAVAWLHDVLEDTQWTVFELAQVGVPSEIIDDLVSLTHRRGESRDDYLARVAERPRALRVKRADIAHNSDPERLAALDEVTRRRLQRKYASSIKTLDRLEAAR